MIKSDQVVESDALLCAAHMFEEAVICNQQEGAGILPVVVGLSLLSVVVPCKARGSRSSLRDTRTRKMFTKSNAIFKHVGQEE